MEQELKVPERSLSSHRIAIHSFEGPHEVVEADEIRFCLPTTQCVQFWATIVACFVAIAIGVFFMIYQGTQSSYFLIGEALLALGVGVLIPGPNFSAMKIKVPSVQ